MEELYTSVEMTSTSEDDVPVFTLKTDSSDFDSRKSNVFDNLQVLEEKHHAFEEATKETSPHTEVESTWKCDPSEEETETITSGKFKKPDLPHRKHGHSSRDAGRSHGAPPWKKRRWIPDHEVHPERWTAYSLEDVDDVNESSNKQAAFAFLEERRKLREAEMDPSGEENQDVNVQSLACSKGAFTFKKASNIPTGKSDADAQLMFSAKKSSAGSMKLDKNLAEISTLSEADTEDEPTVGKTENTDRSQTETAKFRSRKIGGKRNIRMRDSEADNSD